MEYWELGCISCINMGWFCGCFLPTSRRRHHLLTRISSIICAKHLSIVHISATLRTNESIHTYHTLLKASFKVIRRLSTVVFFHSRFELPLACHQFDSRHGKGGKNLFTQVEIPGTVGGLIRRNHLVSIKPAGFNGVRLPTLTGARWNPWIVNLIYVDVWQDILHRMSLNMVLITTFGLFQGRLCLHKFGGRLSVLYLSPSCAPLPITNVCPDIRNVYIHMIFPCCATIAEKTHSSLWSCLQVFI